MISTKFFQIAGALYVTFAIFTAMAATRSLADDSQEAPSHRDLQLSSNHSKQDVGFDPSEYTITVWSGRNCYWCEKFKKEIPKLKKLGYPIKKKSIDKEPRPKVVKGVPTCIVTKKGKTVAIIVGYRTSAFIDKYIRNGTNTRVYFGWRGRSISVDINISGQNCRIRKN